MEDVTWSAVGILVPTLVAGFGLLWQLGDRHHRDIERLRSELRAEMHAGFAELRQAIAALTDAQLRHLDRHP